MNLIEVKNLNKSFSKKNILNDLSFAVPAGTVTGFIGSNGAGKTTFIKCLMGFISPDSGEVHKNTTEVGYFSERPYFHDFLTAKQFLKFHWDLSGGKEGFESAADEVLQTVRLSQVREQKLKTFSKGMLQRIGLAQALLRHPKLLVLDEPMSGLDPEGRLLMKQIIRKESARGATLFFSTHVLSDVKELCDRLIVIESGRCSYQGPVVDFKLPEEI